MIALILALLAGCVPPLIVFFWLRNYLNKENVIRSECAPDQTGGTGYIV